MAGLFAAVQFTARGGRVRDKKVYRGDVLRYGKGD